ncbi:hypothetical protein PPL_09828 [Heterostelium album PN500]|uniref:Uncharacterized protein n=1 Tax=Heterostelium pallidum (strain ATCC 26659 / Pp 5 / PN500) TaxID=670386 RepID=D3BP65_HETP5|nr:hypothetical protein PPL_09828 [Heterostelium album PN500]EFA77075.1 hypothetical protein PPL_09828 [Heterostelium album PN500]|eukprot:XP_020429204.1 hypothetical protein PPL_09828 [Heterostelium album PN500]
MSTSIDENNNNSTSNSSSNNSVMMLDVEEYIEALNKRFTIKLCNSKDLQTNLKELFPTPITEILSKQQPIHLILVWTPTTLPMSGYSDRTDVEREQVANTVTLASKICKSISDNNNNNSDSVSYWSDFIDPLSGVPYLNRENVNSIFIPTDMGVPLGIDIIDVGCCQVMRHPEWRVRALFSMIVTNAPIEIISNAIKSQI